MFTYILKRLMFAIPTLLIIIVLSYMLMFAAPGGPFTMEKQPPPEVIAALEAKFGLDQSMPMQIFNYVKNIVLHFDFGPSFVYRDRDVNEIIANGFPVTLYYGTVSFIVAVLFGVTAGVVAALNHNSTADYVAVGASIAAESLPNFVLAPILVVIFTLWLGWLPGGGWENGRIEYLIMPVIALSTSYFASITRIMRGSMLEVLNSPFIRTAKAKGLPMRKIVTRHALKPALMPVISYLGLAFVGMITGSIVIDQIFSTGGIGKDFVSSALNRDYSVIMGVTILAASLTIFFNLVVDVLYAWIDPKIRY